MRKNKLANTHLELSVIGFGAWAIGGGGWRYGWGPQEDRDSIHAIQAALDSGVNWIDTAHVYGFGHSEEVVGKAVEGRRESVILATKCGLVKGNDGVTPANNLKADSVRSEIENSLRRLKTDVIDLYQIHWPNPEDQIEEAWEEIQKAIAAGKIRHAGVCNFSVEQIKRLQAIAPVVSLQPPYSMLRRAIEDSQMPYCHANNIGIVSYSPMQSGLLTGKLSREWVDGLDEGDWRKQTKEAQEPNLSINVEFVANTLKPLADQYGVQPGQIAIAWVLAGSKVTSAIVGARSRKQVESNVKAAGITLSADELETIEEGLKDRLARLG
jgi:aryl-alcohol dehydrogenase-like predicted oxidoreductase